MSEYKPFTCDICGFYLAKAKVGHTIHHKCDATIQQLQTISKAVEYANCIHRGEQIDSVECKSCGGRFQVAVYECAIHERCRLKHAEDETGKAGMSCRWCMKKNKGFEPRSSMPNLALPEIVQLPAGSRVDAIATLKFLKTEDLIADTLKLIPSLGRIARVIGIARSGMLPATVVATHTGCELWSIDQQSLTMQHLGGGARTTTFNPDKSGKTILIDDSAWTGAAMRSCLPVVQAQFPDAETASIYWRDKPECYRPQHVGDAYDVHYFEWNIEHVSWSNDIGWDMDGVLCRDFTADEDDDGERYIETMRNMEPTKWCVASKPKTIITARRSVYRDQTKAWLTKHNINVNRLIMWTGGYERKAEVIAAWKASMIKAHRLRVYVESSTAMAKLISVATAKINWNIPVICTEDFRVWEAKISRQPIIQERHLGLKEGVKYLDSTTKWIAAGCPTRPKDVQLDILNTCRNCDEYRQTLGNLEWCGDCGCTLAVGDGILDKIARATEHCPLPEPKW